MSDREVVCGMYVKQRLKTAVCTYLPRVSYTNLEFARASITVLTVASQSTISLQLKFTMYGTQEDELNCLTVYQVLQVHIAIYRISGIHIDT